MGGILAERTSSRSSVTRIEGLKKNRGVDDELMILVFVGVRGDRWGMLVRLPPNITRVRVCQFLFQLVLYSK